LIVYLYQVKCSCSWNAVCK